MEYTLKNVTILAVCQIDGKKVVNHWKEPMTLIVTDQGNYIDHLHNHNDWCSKIYETVEITEATLRNVLVDNWNWGCLGKTKWME